MTREETGQGLSQEIIKAMAKEIANEQNKETIKDVIDIYNNKYKKYKDYKKAVSKREWTPCCLQEEWFDYITELAKESKKKNG